MRPTTNLTYPHNVANVASPLEIELGLDWRDASASSLPLRPKIARQPRGLMPQGQLARPPQEGTG